MLLPDEDSSAVVVEELLLSTGVPHLVSFPNILADELQSLVIFGLLETTLNIKSKYVNTK